MIRMRSRWLVIAVAVLLVTPAGIAVAQDDTETSEETDDEEFDDEQNASANESEASDEDDEAEDDEEEADDEDEASAQYQPDHAGPESSWDEDNGTYTGEHLQLTVDEELPGLTDVAYLEHDATVFASVALVGENLTYHAHQNVLSGETDENEFAAVDDDGGHLGLEGDDDAKVTIEVADGVDVNRSERYSDDDSSAYQLHLDANATVWFYGEDLAYDNGTFTASDDARLSAAFPAEEHEDEREDERHERAEEREDHREAGSQWDRTNDSFEGEHVSFTLDANDTRILDYALNGSVIPVFAEVDLPEDNESEWEAHGKHFELRTDDERIRVVDVPPAILEIRADDDTSAQLVVADGVNVTEIDHEDDDDEDNESDERKVYELSLAENRTGWLFGEDLELDNGTFTVGDRAMFRAMPTHPEASPNKGPGSMPAAAEDDREAEEDDDDDDDERGPPDHARVHEMDRASQVQVEQARAAGQVGAEVHVGDDEEPVNVEMGDVQITRSWAESDDEDGVRAGMQIEAPDDAPGTTVTMNLEEGALDGVNVSEIAGELAVSFDNETIAMADDLEDVLDATDDEGEAEYLVMVGGDGVQVLVSVPHFSPHTVEVYQTQSTGDQLDGSEVPGFGAVGMILATGLASIVAVRKHR